MALYLANKIGEVSTMEPPDRVYLYQKGKFNPAFQLQDFVVATTSGGMTYISWGMRTTNTVDLTPYTKLCAYGEHRLSSGFEYRTLMISPDTNLTTFTGREVQRRKNELDISDKTGKYYLFFGFTQGSDNANNKTTVQEPYYIQLNNQGTYYTSYDAVWLE